MNAAVKYTLARVGLFLAVFAALLPVPMNLLLKLMLAVLASAGLSFVLFRGWRDDMAGYLAAAAARRRAEKERLRSALAGDEALGSEGASGDNESGGPRD